MALLHYKRYRLYVLLAEDHLPLDIFVVNLSSSCDICRRAFFKAFNLCRHNQGVHGKISKIHHVTKSRQPLLQHPFKFIVAGSGCSQRVTVWA